MTRSLRLSWLPKGVVLAGALPGLGLAWQAWHAGLGKNPTALALNRLGLTALVFLIATLACTPCKLLFGWTWPARIRRNLGLLCFGYALAHLTTYLAVDQGFDWPVIGADLMDRKFILAGAAAFLCLLPLALTSTQGMVRRLGYPRWKALHRLVYAAAGLAALHFVLRVKRHREQPLLYAALIGILLFVRVRDGYRKRQPQPAALEVAPRA